MISIHVKTDPTTPTVILSAHRDTLIKLPYFANLLAHGMREAQTNTLVLEEVEASTVQRCLDFLARDQISVPQVSVPQASVLELPSEPQSASKTEPRVESTSLQQFLDSFTPVVKVPLKRKPKQEQEVSVEPEINPLSPYVNVEPVIPVIPVIPEKPVSPYDNLSPQQKELLNEVPYLDLCRLHHFADRLVYDKLKQACAHLLDVCLNQVTVVQLLAYCRSVHVNDSNLYMTLTSYVERSEEFQTDVVTSLINRDDLEELLNLPISPMVKSLIGVTWCQANLTEPAESVITTVLKRVQSEILKTSPTDNRHKRLIERLVALGSPAMQLMATLLTLMSGHTTAQLNPAGYNIIQLAEFDATKLSVGSVQTRYGSGYNKQEKYKDIELLYDGMNNWVLEMPTFGFNGLYTCGHRDNEPLYELAFLQDLMEWAHRDEPEFTGSRLVNQVFDAIEYAVAQICVNLRDELKLTMIQSVAALLDSNRFARIRMYNHAPLSHHLLPKDKWGVKVKLNRTAALLDHWSGHQLVKNELGPTPLSLRYPYLMHRGLLQMSKIYVGLQWDSSIIFIQRHLVHGAVEISPVIKPRSSPTSTDSPNPRGTLIESNMNATSGKYPGTPIAAMNLNADLEVLTRLKAAQDNHTPKTPSLHDFLATAPTINTAKPVLSRLE